MNATLEDIRAGLAGIVNEISGVPVEEIVADKSFADDLDIDVLCLIEVAVVAEDEFGVPFPDETVKGIKTVGDVIEHILANR